MAAPVETAPDREIDHDPDLDRLKRDGAMTLRFSPALIDLVEGLARRMDAPVTGVLTEAIVFFGLAVEAQEDGLRFCFADDDLNVVREVVGFGLPEEEAEGEPAADGR